MLNFTHDTPTRLHFGKGQICHLEEELNRFGKRVLLTYGGGSIKKIGLYDEVLEILNKGGFTVVECGGIEPNPRIESVERGVALCKEHDIDVILAVGGGSTIDCSKAIAVGRYHEGDLWELAATSRQLHKALPIVTILTIAATGSEFDNSAVISNMKTHEKIGSLYCFPTVSICDPTYTFSVSKYQTASGAVDIMSHIFEGYFSATDDSDLFEGIEETVLRSVIKNLPIALAEPTNYSARANLMANSSIACADIPEYGKEPTGWPCHGLEHELSAYYDITHGVGLAILTPRWMRYILKKDPSCTWRFAKFARNIWNLQGEDEAALAVAGIDKLEEFFRSTGLPMSLSELGIGTEHFHDMASHVVNSGRMAKGYVPLDYDDVMEIYKDCL